MIVNIRWKLMYWCWRDAGNLSRNDGLCRRIHWEMICLRGERRDIIVLLGMRLGESSGNF